MTCKTCFHYNVDTVKDKAGRVRNDRVAQCNWTPPFPLPDSAKNYSGNQVIIRTSFMGPKDGINCPCYQARIGEQK